MKTFSADEKSVILAQIKEFKSKQGKSIKESCLKYGISVPSYYRWKQDSNKSKESVESSNLTATAKKEKEKEKDAFLDPPKPPPASKISAIDRDRILEIKACFPHMGVKQLRQHLKRNHKIVYSERQIRQLFETENIPKIQSGFPPQPVRRFERDLPNEMWQIDIMSFNIGVQSFYLTSFLDDYSRFIVSYTVSEEATSEVIICLLRRAISFRKPLSIISDRGIQFCSWNGVTRFQMELSHQHIDHLLAREHHPQTMGKIEAFHKTIKRELLTSREFSDIDEARLVMHDYIMFYNFSRPHMGINNQSPAERYFKQLRAYNHQSFYHRRVVGTETNAIVEKKKTKHKARNGPQKRTQPVT